MKANFCIYCNPFGLRGGYLFHPIGDKTTCPRCRREVRRGQLMIVLEFKGGVK